MVREYKRNFRARRDLLKMSLADSVEMSLFSRH
jgi:hypothetical protein